MAQKGHASMSVTKKRPLGKKNEKKNRGTKHVAEEPINHPGLVNVSMLINVELSTPTAKREKNKTRGETRTFGELVRVDVHADDAGCPSDPCAFSNLKCKKDLHYSLPAKEVKDLHYSQGSNNILELRYASSSYTYYLSQIYV